jgi:glycerol uptake facilitator-like aquaporin
LYIGAAIWFMSSTAFANPAVTIARTLTNTFTGIHYANILPFILFQLLGCISCLFVIKKIYKI